MIDAEAASNLTQRVAAGAGWAQIARLAEVGFTLVLTVLFVRLLGPELYGEYAFIVSVASLGAVLLSLGQSEALGRFFAAFVAEGRISQLRYVVRRFVTVRVLVLAAALAILATGHEVLARAFNLPLLSTHWVPIAALLFGQVIIEVATSYEYARLGSRAVALARTIGQALALVFFVVIAGLLGWRDPLAATLTVVLSYALATLTLFTRGLGRMLVAGESTPVDLKPITGFAMGAWGTLLFTIGLAGQIDVLLLSGFQKGAREIAFYSVATLVFLKLNVLLSGWASTAVASFAELQAHRGADSVRSLFGVYTRAHLLISLLVYPLVTLLSGQIVWQIFGPEYTEASGLMTLYGCFWIALSFFFPGISYALLLASNLQGQTLTIRGIGGALNITLDILLIPPLGALGAVVATGVANTLAYASDFVAAARRMRMGYPWQFALQVGGASAIASTPVLLLKPDNWVAIGLAAVIYYTLFLAVLLVTKPLSLNDLELVRRVSPRATQLVARLVSPSGNC